MAQENKEKDGENAGKRARDESNHSVVSAPPLSSAVAAMQQSAAHGGNDAASAKRSRSEAEAKKQGQVVMEGGMGDSAATQAFAHEERRRN